MYENLSSTLVYQCHKYHNLKSSNSGILSKKHQAAVKELLQNQSILLSRPDKGAGWVLMDKCDYISKLETLLSDETKFQCLSKDRDQTKQTELKIINLLKDLKNRNLLPPTQFERLTPCGSQPPRLYGLPKVHKPNLPIRPVIDMSSSPYHAVAQWLVSVHNQPESRL
uniref:Uncharacterized protein n=1 Tax=Oryzias sinensis TaxID=183150 RepID=A0A8C8DS70_9TELE